MLVISLKENMALKMIALTNALMAKNVVASTLTLFSNLHSLRISCAQKGITMKMSAYSR
jgi:hypothetical protein